MARGCNEILLRDVESECRSLADRLIENRAARELWTPLCSPKGLRTAVKRLIQRWHGWWTPLLVFAVDMRRSMSMPMLIIVRQVTVTDVTVTFYIAIT